MPRGHLGSHASICSAALAVCLGVGTAHAESYTSFRGAHLGMTVSEATSALLDEGFHATVKDDGLGNYIEVRSKTYANQCAFFYSNGSSPQSTITKLTFWPCYFNADNELADEFIPLFMKNYEGLNNLSFKYISDGAGTNFNMANTLLKGGEWASITVWPHGSFEIEIKPPTDDIIRSLKDGVKF